MEMQVIEGAGNLISKFKPIIAYEQHLELDDISKPKAFLSSKFGYNVYIINEILPGCRLDCRNFLAFPPGKEDLFFEKFPNEYGFLSSFK